MKQKEYCKPESVCIGILSEQAVFNTSFTGPDDNSQLPDFGHRGEEWDD